MTFVQNIGLLVVVVFRTILSGYVALLTLYCHQEKEELLI